MGYVLWVMGYVLCVYAYPYPYPHNPIRKNPPRFGVRFAFGEHLAVVGGLSAWVWHCKGVGGFPAV